MENRKIVVTEPVLPDLKEFNAYLEQIWQSKWLTNNGSFHQELEQKLCEFLGVKYISLFSNGTLALITALQALELEGEVITTPYSFVATAHSIWWNKLKPIFVDVDTQFGNIIPEEIEKAITEKTTAILPVHVYGNPCENHKIQEIANKYSLKLIYDAAHAFAVTENGNSILNYGDLSILSFHATKVYNTIEGGAIVCNSAEMKKHIDYLKNFGFEDETTVIEPGINAKMNEVQAAYGLLQLKTIHQNIEDRKNVAMQYISALDNVSGIKTPFYQNNIQYNYSYFPILIDENLYGKSRDALYFELQKHNIFGRRYFYPLITDFQPYNKINQNPLFNAKRWAEQVICLPIFPTLSNDDIQKIVSVIRNFA